MFGAEDVVGTTSCEISLSRAKAHSLKERLKLEEFVNGTSIKAVGTSLAALIRTRRGRRKLGEIGWFSGSLLFLLGRN